MKKIFTICLFLITISATAQHFHWVQTGMNGATGSNIASENNLVASTAGGNVGAGQVTAPYVLTVQDTTGSTLWSKSIFCRPGLMLAPNHAPAVAIDNNQNVIIAGSFRDSLFIGNRLYKAPANAGTMFYVVKYNASGAMLWERHSVYTQGQNTSSVSVSLDAGGNAYVSGSFSGTLAFGSTIISASGFTNGFVAKYDPNGNFLWARAAATTDPENLVRSKAAPNGSVYLASTYYQPGLFVTSKLHLVKYDTNGNLLWNRIIAPAGNSTVSMAVDNANNLYLAASYTNSVDFTGNFSLTAITNFNTYLAKFSGNGNFKWAKNIATGNSFTTSPPAIFYASDNTLAVAGSFNGMAGFVSGNVLSSPSGSRNGYIVKTDTAGTLLWSKTIPNTTGENVLTAITGSHTGSYYVAGHNSGSASYSGAIVNSAAPQAIVAHLKALRGNATTGSSFNLITGRIFLDTNSNGIRDANETGAGETFIGTSSNVIGNIVHPDGTYNLLVPMGTFTITPAPKKYHNYAPATHLVSFSRNNQTATGKDFALQAIPNQTDVRVNLISVAGARPGFNFSYNLTIENTGTTTVSDTLSLTYNSALASYTSSTVPSTVNQPGKLKWFYTNLQPNEIRHIRANFVIPVTAALGSNLQASAYLRPLDADLYPADNYDTTRVAITGSYDPNDKQVNKASISPAAAAQGDYLDYTIRFQNTGTDTAFTVVIADQIAATLDLSTIETLSASHPYRLSLQNGNRLEWRFDNILLPDSNRNEPASHGFVKFRIKTKAGLLLDDTIANQAAIYFDYNAPVITNYAVTRVAYPAGTKPVKELQTLKLYPNPARNYVVVAAQFNQKLPSKITLVNILGQKIEEVNLPANKQFQYRMEFNKLPKGVYVVQLENEAGSLMQRLVIQ